MQKLLFPAFSQINTPAYVIDEAKLIKNLEILKGVTDRTGCKILLAQKAFSAYAMYPLISRYLCGTTASGLYEAKLGAEEFGGETHVFSPAYKESEFGEIVSVCDHIVFNSFSQLKKFRSACAGKSIGIRINPEFSTQDAPIYDPCAPYSRLGVTRSQFDEEAFEGVDGIHFHTLCEQDSDALEATVGAVEARFGEFLKKCRWINLGGGHHITKEDYDTERLERVITGLKERYGAEVYLEPGEAVALGAGYLVTSVLDFVHNDMDIALLDTSAECHMPDVLEMPYRPPLYGAGMPGEKAHTYRLSSCTCLAGDVIGDYSFDEPLEAGDRLSFCDMAIYSFVKNNTFNGMPLPEIGVLHTDGSYETVKRFGYHDFKERLS